MRTCLLREDWIRIPIHQILEKTTSEYHPTDQHRVARDSSMFVSVSYATANQCALPWRGWDFGEDLKSDLTRSWCQHVLTHHSRTNSRDPVRELSLEALPGQVHIFLTSVLRIHVHMTDTSHNVTRYQELSVAENDLWIHDLFYRLEPQGSEIRTMYSWGLHSWCMAFWCTFI